MLAFCRMCIVQRDSPAPFEPMHMWQQSGMAAHQSPPVISSYAHTQPFWVCLVKLGCWPVRFLPTTAGWCDCTEWGSHAAGVPVPWTAGHASSALRREVVACQGVHTPHVRPEMLIMCLSDSTVAVSMLVLYCWLSVVSSVCCLAAHVAM